MSATFKLEILVPSGRVLDEQVESVQIPTAMGVIGVLPDHAQLAAVVGTGIMEIGTGSGAKRMVVSGGFLNFANNQLKVVADSIDTVESVDKANYSKERDQHAQTVASSAVFEPGWANAKAKLERIDAIDMLLAGVNKNSLN